MAHWLKNAKWSSIVALATLYGCAADTAEGLPDWAGPTDLELEESAAAAGAEEGAAGDVDDKAGDSYVDWCNHPDVNIGTLCRQQNCSGGACYGREAAAIAECRAEVRNVCGSATQPWYIVFKADGYWQRLY